MKSIRAGLSILAFALASGCAFTPQAIDLQPKVFVAENAIGKGRVVFVNVVDERPRKTLGTRGPGMGADLTLKGDLSSILRSTIIGGLTRQGFSPTRESVPGATELSVEIRDLEYEVRSGFWAGSLRTECNLKGICKRESAVPYKNRYNGKFESSIQVVQSEERNNQFVNTAVSKALDALLNDKKMMECLAGDQ
jgi:uncharacterized lipoprotein YajG